MCPRSRNINSSETLPGRGRHSSGARVNTYKPTCTTSPHKKQKKETPQVRLCLVQSQKFIMSCLLVVLNSLTILSIKAIPPAPKLCLVLDGHFLTLLISVHLPWSAFRAHSLLSSHVNQSRRWPHSSHNPRCTSASCARRVANNIRQYECFVCRWECLLTCLRLSQGQRTTVYS